MLKWKRLFKRLSLFFLLFFFIHILVILVDGWTDEKEFIPVTVVLGNKVHEDGTPSDRLKARLDAAVALYAQKKTSTIIVSGGYGKEKQWEGTVMQEYLLEKSIPKTDIVIDNEGNTTQATILNIKKKMPELNQIIVVSQYHHITRTKLAFKMAGFKKVNGVHARFFEWRDFYSIPRECIAFYYYLLKY